MNKENRSQLEELYSSIDILKKHGLDVPESLSQQIRDKENEYIDKEIIPLIKMEVKDLLSAIRVPVTLEIVSKDGEVTILRKEETSNDDSCMVSESEEVYAPVKSFAIKVTFPDGRIVCERFVKYTLAEVVRYAGCENIYNLKYPMYGSFLLSKERHPKQRYADAQIEVEPNYFLMTNSNSEKKYQQILFISQKLNLDLKVEKVPLEEARSSYNYTFQLQTDKKHTNQNHSTYSLNGGEFLNKVNFVVAFIEAIWDYDSDCTFADLQELLPMNSSNNRTVLSLAEWEQKNDDAQRRYALNHKFRTSDGVEFYVSTQWTKDAFDKKLLPAVEGLGFTWEERE